MTILQVRLKGPDHVQLTHVVWRLNVNLKNYQQIYFTIQAQDSLEKFFEFFVAIFQFSL